MFSQYKLVNIYFKFHAFYSIFYLFIVFVTCCAFYQTKTTTRKNKTPQIAIDSNKTRFYLFDCFYFITKILFLLLLSLLCVILTFFFKTDFSVLFINEFKLCLLIQSFSNFSYTLSLVFVCVFDLLLGHFSFLRV